MNLVTAWFWFYVLLTQSFSGVHHKKTGLDKDCEATATVKRVQDILTRANKFLFPDKLFTKEIPIRRKLKVQYRMDDCTI